MSSVRAGGSAATASSHPLALLVPAGAIALGEAARARTPSRRTRAREPRSTPSRFLEYARDAAARVGAELLRGPRPGDDRRDRATALGEHARLLDVHADADHNRSVFTLVGDEDELVDALVAGVACARERIDLRRARGRASADRRRRRRPDRPDRRPSDMPRAQAAAQALAARIGASSGCRSSSTASCARPRAGVLPARRPGRAPAADRRGRADAGLRAARLDPAAGAVLVGARRPLIAFNVNLRGELEAAREIAARRPRDAAAASRACARSGSTCRAPGSSR